MIEYQADSRSTSQSVRYWVMALVFLAKLQLTLPGISSPLIEVLVQLNSTIQSRMMFLDFLKPTSASCNLLWMYHTGSGTPQEWQISHQRACIRLCSALYICVSVILNMVSSTLNQWMHCTQLVIYSDTSRLGSGSSSHSASADTSINTWSE
jgi:hypothetical protein